MNQTKYCLSDTIVQENEAVALTCTADEANPTSQITWYRDDDPVTEGVVNYEEKGD